MGILARLRLAKIQTMARPNSHDMLPKRTKKVRLGIEIIAAYSCCFSMLEIDVFLSFLFFSFLFFFFFFISVRPALQRFKPLDPNAPASGRIISDNTSLSSVCVGGVPRQKFLLVTIMDKDVSVIKVCSVLVETKMFK